MMPDYQLGETLDFKFTTRDGTGLPTTFAGSPAVEVYEDNSVTQITAGITLTVDFDSVTGLNNLRIVATGGNGFEAGKSYAAVVSAGTVDSISVVGEVLAQFTIERSPVNWANVTAPSTTVDLSATDINSVDTASVNTDIAAILGTLADAAAAGDPTASDTVVAYLKQLINTLEGTAGIPTFPAEAAPANAVSLSEVIRAIHSDVTGLNGDVMRGTDGANTVVPLAAATDQAEHDATQATLAGLNDISPAQVNAEVDTALSDIGLQFILNTALPTDWPTDITANSALDYLADDGTVVYDRTSSSQQAIRDAIGTIGSASGGALNFEATGDNTGGPIKGATFVGVQTGTFANTEAEDGVLHTIDDTANEIDIVYQFAVGGARTASEVSFKGYLTSGNDTLNIQAYDFVGADWETRATLTGQGGTSNITQIVPLLAKHTGIGADLGDVLIRFQNSGLTNPQLNTDELLVEAVSIGQSVGYDDGAVWLDTTASNTNTESFVDGVADNPVSTIAAALTIASNVGLRKLKVAPGSSFTLAASLQNFEVSGHEYTLDLGGQDCAGTWFEGATLAASTATGAGIIFERCIFDNNMTLPPCVMRWCFLGDMTITAGSAGNFFINYCVSRAAGVSVAPNFDFGAAVANTNLNVRHYSGGFEIENYNVSGTDNMTIEGNGNLIVNANCTGGDVAIRGNFDIIDNAGGAVTFSDDARFEVDNVDATLVAAHGAGSWTTGGAGSGLASLSTGTAQAGTVNSLTLAVGEPATNNFYNNQRLVLTGGTGAGQSRPISDNPGYDGTTKIATVVPDWDVTPDGTTEYEIQAADVEMRLAPYGVVDDTAFASTLTEFESNITEATIDHYVRANKGRTILFTSGAMKDQQVEIQAYSLVGGKGHFTVDTMTDMPANGVTFRIL